MTETWLDDTVFNFKICDSSFSLFRIDRLLKDKCMGGSILVVLPESHDTSAVGASFCSRSFKGLIVKISFGNIALYILFHILDFLYCLLVLYCRRPNAVSEHLFCFEYKKFLTGNNLQDFLNKPNFQLKKRQYVLI